MNKTIYSILSFLVALTCQIMVAQSTSPSSVVPDSTSQYSTPVFGSDPVGAGKDVALFAGGTSQFQAQPGAISYSWSPATGLSDSTISNPFVTVNTTTTYTVRIQTNTDTNYYIVRAVVIVPAPSSAASCSNWVPNGDFESHIGCVDDFGELPFQTNWMDAGGSCDLYTACNFPKPWTFFVTGYIDYVEVPQNASGYQNSSVYGNSYAGLILSSYASIYPYFEYTRAKLPCALVNGQRYKMQFDASWGNKSNFSCGNIGLLVSTNAISASPSGSQIIASPQVDGSCGTNTNWTTFSSIYTGAGEQYVTIGDFDSNPASQDVCTRIANYNTPEPPFNTEPPQDYTYNYIDNIVIAPIPPTISSTYSVNCAGLGTPPTNPNNMLTETGSPGNLCSWYGPGGVFLGTGSSVQINTPNVTGTYVYTVSVDLSSECSLCTTPLTNTISIQVLPLTAGAVITPTITSGPVCANSNTGVGNVFGHIVSPTSGTTYIWDPVLISNSPHTSGHFSLPPGVYTVNVTTGNCSGLGTTTFTIEPFPVFTVTASSYSLCSPTYSTTTLTASDPSFNYTWSPTTGLNATTGTSVVATLTTTNVNGNSQVYTAHATNSFGCTAVQTVTVHVAATPTIQISKHASGLPCSANNTTYTLTANGVGSGIGGTDNWSPPGTNTTSIIVTPTITTTYTLTETSALGCTAQGVTTITVNPTPTVTAIATSPVCSGTSATLTAMATPTNSTTIYHWLPSGYSTNPAYTPTSLSVGVHNYTVTVNTNGCIGTATVNVNVNPLPPKPQIAGGMCIGETTVLTVTNTTAGETYSWAAPSGGSVSCNNSPVCSSETIINAVSGVYSVTATDVNGCVSPTATIAPKPAPIASISYGPNQIDCVDGPAYTYTLTGHSTSGGSTYSWSTGANTQTISVTPTVGNNTYILNVTNSAGCTATATLTIPIYPNPTVSIAPVSSVCLGASATLTAIATPTTATIHWQGYSVTGANSSNNPLVTNPLSSLAPYVYTVTAIQNGCHSAPATVTITANQLPYVYANASPSTICPGSSSSLTTGATNMSLTSYTWSPATTLSSSSTNPTVATPTVTTQYTVYATGSDGCVGMGTVDVTVAHSPNIGVTSSRSICYGSGTPLIASGNSDTYSWAPNTGLSATTGSLVIATPSVTTVYTVTGTNSSTGCSSTATTTITVIPTPTISVTNQTICVHTTATLTASGADTYTWNPAAANPNANPHITGVYNTAGSYTVSVTGTSTTVVGTSTVGCTGQATATITVLPLSNITVNSATICEGASATLTANGGISYTWSPSTGLSSTIGNTVTANPTVTTTYTITGSNANGCTSSAVATVTVIPSTSSVAITASSNPICAGTSVTLSASGGATSYTWTGTPGSGINGSNHHATTIITPSLTSNQTYTLVGSNGGAGCTATSVLTVSVLPTPTLAVTYSVIGNCSSTTTVCAGSAVTLFVNSSTLTDYTVMPGNLTGSILSPVIVTPSSSTTYTVYVTDGTCVGSQTINIPVTNCSAGLTTLPTSGTYTGGHFYLSSTVTLTGNLDLISSQIRAYANATIIVPPNVTLRIIQSHIKAITNNMWQGIVVQQGGTVVVDVNSMVEDAIVAIDNNPGNTIQTGNPAIIQSRLAIYNCNRTAIRNAYYQDATVSNYDGNHFKVTEGVITCRCGIQFSSGLTPLINYQGGGTVVNPTIDDSYSIANFAPATLLNPYMGQPALEGIHFENNGVPTSTNTALGYVVSENVTTYPPPSSGELIFDNLTYGVNAINTTFTVVVAAFQRPKLASSGGGIFPIANVGGYAINANNTDPNFVNAITVTKTQFIDMVRGVHTTNYALIDFTKNTVFSQQVQTPANSISLIPPQGSYGIYANTPRFASVNINNNHIANINNCIDFVINQNSSYVTSGDNERIGPITISNNVIQDQFPTTSYTNRYIGNAIVVDNVIAPPNPNQPKGTINSTIAITTNTITNAYRGIFARNHQYQIVQDESNVITTKYEPTDVATPTTQYGIQHNNLYKNYSDIWNNNVTGFTTNFSDPTIFEPKKGIWCNLNYNTQTITCNTVTTVGRGMEFSGWNLGTTWRLNQMSNSGEGFVLSSNSGGGEINTQGSATDASDNQWSGFSSINPETYVDAGSSANSSILYVQSTSLPYAPQNNQGLSISPYSFFFGSLILASNSSSISCSSAPLLLTVNSDTTSVAIDNTATMKKIVQDSVVYASDSIQNSQINKDVVYQSLKADTTLMATDTVLQNFYLSNQTANRGLLSQTEDILATGDYATATSLLNSITPANTMEQNHKRFYQVYINAMQGNATSADSADLENIASSCPLFGGIAVHKARAFHNAWHLEFKHYEDNCPINNTSINQRIAKNQNTTLPTSSTSRISIYPNPSTGIVYIQSDEGTDYQAEMRDLSGKVLYRQVLSMENGVGKLKLNFDNGAYLLYLYNSNGKNAGVFKVMIAD